LSTRPNGQFAPRSSLELRADNPHLVVVRTFSKTWSRALRLGYAIADPDVVDAMFRRHLALTTSTR